MLHNVERCNLHSSQTIIRMVKSKVEHVTCRVTKTNSCKVLVGRPEGKMPLGRYRDIWSIILKLIFER
jgi:hypothetical protein